jgi:predicted murein hydrolase (TIGR00659 family)
MFIGLIALLSTILLYLGARALYQRYPAPFTLPILVSTFLMVTILLGFGISYETYYSGGRWIELLLGPAVVALAYPLYRQLEMLKTYFYPIVLSVMIGAIVGIVSGLLLAKLFGIERKLVFSIMPKSVTTPVAMDIAQAIGGIPSLAAVMVMVAGIGGVVFSPYIYRWFNIKEDIGKAVGLGCASHAIGTAKALEANEKQGASSSVAMTISAIVVSIIGPILVYLFY